MTTSDGIAGGRILSLIERIEQLEEEIKALNEGKKEVFAEAKGHGFDVKIMRMVIKVRKMEGPERQEQEALLETYLSALGIES